MDDSRVMKVHHRFPWSNTLGDEKQTGGGDNECLYSALLIDACDDIQVNSAAAAEQ